MTIVRQMSFSLVVSAALVLSACGEKEELAQDSSELSQSATDQLLSPDSSGDSLGDAALAAVEGASEIPYPVYPNGSKYRVGGEHGLKIVVFETEDTFEEVDKFYKSAAEPSVMPRLVAMNDYVRYSSDANDIDPWATYRPGIVIHQFNDESERSAVGAKPDSRTNIIMSY